jgi:hypothetical protein
MKSVVVSFLDLTSDEMADILTCCDLWYGDTATNRESFRALVADGRLMDLAGELSMFSGKDEPMSVLQDALQHYNSDTFDGAFSGHRDYIKITGLSYDQTRDALQDNDAIHIEQRSDGVVITPRKSKL